MNIPPGITYRTFTPGVITGGLPDPHTTWHHAACNHCGWDTDSRNNPAWEAAMTGHRCGMPDINMPANAVRNPTPGPYIGAHVHYRSYGTPSGEYTAECRAAVITEVSDFPNTEGARTNIAVPVGLCVTNPTGLFFRPITDGGSMQSELGREGGTWHWPCDGT